MIHFFLQEALYDNQLAGKVLDVPKGNQTIENLDTPLSSHHNPYNCRDKNRSIWMKKKIYIEFWSLFWCNIFFILNHTHIYIYICPTPHSKLKNIFDFFLLWPMANTFVVVCTIDWVISFNWNLLSSAFVFASSTFIISAGWCCGSNHQSPWISIHCCFNNAPHSLCCLKKLYQLEVRKMQGFTND